MTTGTWREVLASNQEPLQGPYLFIWSRTNTGSMWVCRFRSFCRRRRQPPGRPVSGRQKRSQSEVVAAGASQRHHTTAVPKICSVRSILKIP